MSRNVICFVHFWIFVSLCNGISQKYAGHKVIRVTPQSDKHINHLWDIHNEFNAGPHSKVNFWKEPSRVRRDVDIQVHPEAANTVMTSLRNEGVSAQVIIEDLSKSIERQLEEGNSFTSTYHPLHEIHDWMFEQMASCYPLCRMVFLGNSTEHRPIYMLKISDGRDTPSIFIDAGIHSREWISPATALYLIEKLLKGLRGEDAQAADMVGKFTWFIVPVVNPDGYAYTWQQDRMWRKSRSNNSGSDCVGVDLNRNWKHKWGGRGASVHACSDAYRGPFAFSQPETRALAYFIWRKKRNIDIYMTFHSYGQFWLLPWGYAPRFPSDYADLLEVGQYAAQRMSDLHNISYSVGHTAAMLYPASGGSFDWVKGKARIKYSFGLELPDKGNHGFVLPPSEIVPTGEHIVDGFSAMIDKVLEKMGQRTK